MTKTRNVLLVVMTIAASVGLAVVLSGFWQPIFWAIIAAILFRPVMAWFETHWPGHKALSAFLVILGIVVAFLLPVLMLGATVVQEGIAIYGRVESKVIGIDILNVWAEEFYQTAFGQRLSGIGLDLATMTEKLQPLLTRVSSFVISLIANIGMDTGGLVMALLLMLYLLFFFLSDGPGIYQRLFAAVPMPADEKHSFFKKFAEVATATILGTTVVGAAQGTLGAILFVALGINGPVFWGFMMAIMSLLPAVGAAIIWLPASIILILTGSWIKGLILLAFGMLVISSVDNLLRPMVVGKKTQMPDYLVLFSTLGGIATFGITGFVVGPVIAALFIASWHLIYEDSV